MCLLIFSCSVFWEDIEPCIIKFFVRTVILIKGQCEACQSFFQHQSYYLIFQSNSSCWLQTSKGTHNWKEHLLKSLGNSGNVAICLGCHYFTLWALLESFIIIYICSRLMVPYWHTCSLFFFYFLSNVTVLNNPLYRNYYVPSTCLKTLPTLKTLNIALLPFSNNVLDTIIIPILKMKRLSIRETRN